MAKTEIDVRKAQAIERLIQLQAEQAVKKTMTTGTGQSGRQPAEGVSRARQADGLHQDESRNRKGHGGRGSKDPCR
jgi:hypothetical protein